MTTKSSRDFEEDVTETFTSQVLGLLFGNAILERVRAERRLSRVLIEALVVASIVAILGWTYVGLPPLLCFSGVIALFGEAFLQVHFADAHNLYNTWTTFRRRAYLVLGVFVLSRLAFGDILDIPHPGVVFADIQTRGGFVNALLKSTPPNIVWREVLLDILIVAVSWSLVVKRSKTARAFFVAQAGAFLFFATFPLVQSAYHSCLKTDSVVVCTWKLLFTGFGPGPYDSGTLLKPSDGRPSGQRERIATSHREPQQPSRRCHSPQGALTWHAADSGACRNDRRCG